MSIGILSASFLAVSFMAAVGVAASGLAAGIFACGGCAASVFALGGAAAGKYAFGGAAVGGMASRIIAVGKDADGEIAMNFPVAAEELKAVINTRLPESPKFIVDFSPLWRISLANRSGKSPQISEICDLRDFLFPFVNSEIKILEDILRFFTPKRQLVGVIQAHAEIVAVPAAVKSEPVLGIFDGYRSTS